MGWVKESDQVRNDNGGVEEDVRVLVDYHQDDTVTNRYAALLQVYDYSKGDGDSIEITPSDASTETWTEGASTDYGFDAVTDNDTTAKNIKDAIDSISNYNAIAITGHAWDPYVYVEYTGGGHIDSASSPDDTEAWEFQQINSTNGTIAKVASDASGTVKAQPIFTDLKGYWEAYIDSKDHVDILYEKSGVDFDNANRTNIPLEIAIDNVEVKDSDGDTRVETEHQADEDLVRIYANGTEIINFDDS